MSRDPSRESPGGNDENNLDGVTRDEAAVPSSPAGKKAQRQSANQDATRSPNNVTTKPVSGTTLSSNDDAVIGINESRKPSRRGPVASRPRIDQFLEKHNHDSSVAGEVFQEPVPSPWRPSGQSGRSRLRLTDSNSRASSVASSKCSTASRRTGALSMFQPHRQVSVESLPGHHSPTHESKGIVSANMVKEQTTTPSLVEQRRRLFQTGNPGAPSVIQSARSFQGSQGNVNKQSSTRSFQGFPKQASVASTTGQEDVKQPLRLPAAHEICSRVSSWHVNAILQDD